MTKQELLEKLFDISRMYSKLPQMHDIVKLIDNIVREVNALDGYSLTCKWKLIKSNGTLVFVSDDCGYAYGVNHSLLPFKHCPNCGGKIEEVK